MNNLTPNRAYKIYQLKHTTHEKYGEGELAFVETNTGLKQRVQLPTKYLRDLTDEEIQCWYSDILNNLCPYLVFRQQLIDTSFEIDIFQRSKNSSFNHFVPHHIQIFCNFFKLIFY